MAESRQELINWLNALLQLNLTKVEQCGTGAAYCQVLDSIYRDVPMSKVKFNVNTEYAYLQNFKILTTHFGRLAIDRPIPVERLVKCKMQDNLEFLQWMKRYWDQYYPGGEYDPVARRKAQGVFPVSTAQPVARASSSGMSKARAAAPQVTGARNRTPIGGASTSALQTEIATLKDSVVGLERERDFYFSKLRDIELLLQESTEDPDETKEAVIKKVQEILYSTEEGFEIPEDEQDGHGHDDETF